MAPGQVVAERIFESTDFRVALFRRTSRAIVVTFDFWEPGRQGFGTAVGGSLMAKQGWSQVHVGTRRNNWFLGAETGDVIAAVARAVSGHDSVVMHGSSMGGYAALLMGGRIGATRAIVISPQFSVDPAKVPFDQRWLKDSAGLDFAWDRLAEWAGGLPRADILYDPRNRPDAAHAHLLLRHAPHWRGVPLAFSGHPAGRVLRETGLFANVIQGLLEDSLPAAEVVRLFKANRRRSMMFWSQLAKQTAKRPALFAGIVERVLALPGGDAESLYALSVLARERGRPACADALVERALALVDQAPRWLADRLREVRRARAK